MTVLLRTTVQIFGFAQIYFLVDLEAMQFHLCMFLASLAAQWYAEAHL